MTHRYFDDFQVGEKFTSRGVTFTESDIIDFGLRYDPQPFHIDHEAAKKSPYEGIIASGWQTCSFVMRALVDNYFSPVSSLGSPGIDELRWILPVRPGDKLMVRATIIEAKLSRSKPDRGIVRTFIETINQHEDSVMSFKAVNFMLCRDAS